VSGGRLLLATHEDVFASSDGRSWEALGVPLAHPLTVAAGDRDVAGGPDGLVEHRDGEWRTLADDLHVRVATWQGPDVLVWAVGSGLVLLREDGSRFEPPALDHADDQITALALAADAIVTAGPNFGVYRDDFDLGARVPTTAATTIGETVYAGGADGVWRFEHGDWEQLDLDTAGPVAAMASEDETLWVLAQGGLLYRSGDQGATWETVATTTS